MPEPPQSQPDRETAGVIAPPPLIFVSILAAGLATDFLVYRMPTGLPLLPRGLVSVVLTGLAILIVLAAWLHFRRAGTPVEPWRTSTALVTDGIYGWSRNPMYLAMVLFYLAIALAVNSLVTMLFLLPLLVLLHYGVIRREERYLERKFGAAYRSYRQRVRRWI
ncbi:methyltransferase family protein [Fodinicurvata halophila]|uniref:Methyltransferase family protein n=1 Tax=Fodinicurvata halophila TaxID=1419723 RepID=A0ABV8UME8_9PROT